MRAQWCCTGFGDAAASVAIGRTQTFYMLYGTAMFVATRSTPLQNGAGVPNHTHARPSSLFSMHVTSATLIATK